jgi:hypothetical protein
MVIYTIGHSTRSLDEFLELLRAHHIGRVADIRTVPTLTLRFKISELRLKIAD